MNLFITLAIGLLSSTANCASFQWHLTKAFTWDHRSEDLASQTLPDGSVHLFTYTVEGGYCILIYEILLPDKTLIRKSKVRAAFKGQLFRQPSAQISNDGKHILVAYVNRHDVHSCNDSFNNPCQKVEFIESFDGGASWSDPISMDRSNKDYLRHSHPTLLLEQDTGRVYISYITDAKPGSTDSVHKLSIREPGDILFKQIASSDAYTYVNASIGLTIDKKNNKRYLHLLTRVFTSGEARIVYRRSETNGKMWSFPITLGTSIINADYGAMYMDTKVDEGEVYVQFVEEDGNVVVRRSKNHGTRFDRGIEIEGYFKSFQLIHCGDEGKKLLISLYAKRFVPGPRVSYLASNTKKFVELPEVFEGYDKQSFRSAIVSCVYMGASNYSITVLSELIGQGTLYVTNGVLNLD